MSRNNERVLSDQMINDIQELMYVELQTNPESVHAVVTAMMNAYLTNDWDSFKEFTTDIIEGYEDDTINILNTQLMEDSFKQAEND